MAATGSASDDVAMVGSDVGVYATGGTTATGGYPGTGGTSMPAAGGSGGGYYAADAGVAAEPNDPSNQGDSYRPVGTNPFTVVSYDPLSTFAADVDTASYDIFRRDINDGVLPQPDSVRLEEYINYFPYDYPTPAHDSAVPFSISLAAAPHVLDRETVLLRVGIQGKAAPPRVPANLVFLVDVSGSMSASNKLPLVKQVLHETLAILEPEDTISVVTYGSTAEVRLGPTSVSERSTIHQVIEGLYAAGSTAGHDGLGLAYQQAGAGFIEGGTNHILLCTDGDFNIGPYTDNEMVAFIEEKRQTGVTLTALGFGTGNLNDSMMEAVSNAGNGVYAVISDPAQAHRYVGERLMSSMLFIAKDMKIQVEFNPEHVYAYRLLGYENRAIADTQFRDDTVDAGEVGAGHRVTAIYELVLVLSGNGIPLPEGAPPAKDGDPYTGEVEVSPTDLVLVKVRYKDVDATETDPAYEVAASLAPDAVAQSYTGLDADFEWAIAIAAFAEILKESPYADPTQLPQIQQIISQPVHQSDRDRAEFASLFATAQGLLQAPAL